MQLALDSLNLNLQSVDRLEAKLDALYLKLADFVRLDP
jgi:hypothetical protein